MDGCLPLSFSLLSASLFEFERVPDEVLQVLYHESVGFKYAE